LLTAEGRLGEIERLGTRVSYLTACVAGADQPAGYTCLRLKGVPDEDVHPLFAMADVAALPYGSITRSGCAMFALAHGRPLLVPELDALLGLEKTSAVLSDAATAVTGWD